MTQANNVAIESSQINSSGVLQPAGGGTGLSTLTTGYIPYGNGTSAFSSSSSLYFDGTNLGIGTNSPSTYSNQKLVVYNNGIAAASGSGLTSGKFEIFSNGQTNNQITLSQGFATTDNIGYLYNRANAAFVFGTNNTEAMRIDSIGNVLIGTTSNSTNAKINVQTDGSAQNRILSFTNTQSGGQTYQFLNGNGNQFQLFNSTTNQSVYNAVPTGNGHAFGIGATVPSVRANDVSLFVGIGSGQNLSLNPGDYSLGLNYYLSSAPYSYTASYYSAKISFYAGQISTGTASSGTAGNAITFTSGPYVANGGTSWTNSSDANLKNITGTIENALDKISQLRAARFTWKTDAENKPQVGLIAQDLQKVLPEVVVVPKEATDQEGNPTYLGVNYDQVIPLLLAGIQEQQALITTLQTQVASLQAKVGA